MAEKVPIEHKLMLTIDEAALYSNIDECKIRELLKMPRCPFILTVGRKQLIKRKQFEEHISKSFMDLNEEPKEEYYEGDCIYFISDGEYVKIGMTKNLKKRLAGLQTANAKRLRVLKTIPTDNPCELERLLHEKYVDKRVNYEWYDILDLFEERKDDKNADNPRGC